MKWRLENPDDDEVGGLGDDEGDGEGGEDEQDEEVEGAVGADDDGAYDDE